MNQKVTFGPASWIGLIGAVAAALAPVFSTLPWQWGATCATVLGAIVVLGRQLQAMVQTVYGDPVWIESSELIDELPAIPTDAPEQA